VVTALVILALASLSPLAALGDGAGRQVLGLAAGSLILRHESDGSDTGCLAGGRFPQPQVGALAALLVSPVEIGGVFGIVGERHALRGGPEQSLLGEDLFEGKIIFFLGLLTVLLAVYHRGREEEEKTEGKKLLRQHGGTSPLRIVKPGESTQVQTLLG